jgi:hypothetical protein
MHLHHPSLTTTGKRRGKQKWASAEAKRKHEELQQEWQDLLKRQGIAAEEQRRTRALKAKPLSGYSLKIPEGRNTLAHAQSVDTGSGSASLAPAKVYTGTDMIGIGQLHKSNAIPIFKKSDAEDLAKMRR